jgi:hypothetical protein
VPDAQRADTRSQDCPSKPKCPIHFEGIDGAGIRRKRQALVDPATGGGVRDWNRAVEIIRELELPKPVEPTVKPQVSFESAIASFLAFKSRRSLDVQRKSKLVLGRLKTFLELRKKFAVAEIGFTDLVEFRAQWTDSSTTQRRNQEVKGFFAFCVKSDFIVKNPALGLDPIREGRPKTEPFTREEIERIFSVISLVTDEYGRQGQPVAAQTRAFVMVMPTRGCPSGTRRS